MKTNLVLPLLMGMTFGTTALAQSMSSMSLSLDRARWAVTQTGDPVLNMDLLGEARRQNAVLKNIAQIELGRVELRIKSGVGGANTYLIVNREFVDSASVETNPDLLTSAGGEAIVELKNTERRVDSAGLQVLGAAKLSAVTLFFGAISETQILGSYATSDAQAVAAAGAGDEKTPAVVPPAEISPLRVRATQDAAKQPVVDNGGVTQAPVPTQVVAAPAPVVVQPAVTPVSRPVVTQAPPAPVVVTRPQPQPVPQPARECVRASQTICVGDIVLNAFGFEGRVLRVYPAERMIEVKFSFSAKPLVREADRVRLK